jgi:hypothetical protein
MKALIDFIKKSGDSELVKKLIGLSKEPEVRGVAGALGGGVLGSELAPEDYETEGGLLGGLAGGGIGMASGNALKNLLAKEEMKKYLAMLQKDLKARMNPSLRVDF